MPTVAAEQLYDTITSHSTMRTAVRLAVHILPGADRTGISVMERTQHRRTVAWTDEIVRAAESWHAGRVSGGRGASPRGRN